MKIYISGKITGLPFPEVVAKFQSAEELLDELDLVPVNPLKNGLTKNHAWVEHMVRDIEMLLACDAIYMLDNWVDSKGARIEKNIADEVGMDIWFESNIIHVQDIVKRVQDAIHEVTGLKFKEYTTKSRHRDAFFARMIFVYHCRRHKMKLTDIAQYVHRDHTAMLHYLKKYNDEVKYNPHFRNLATNVDDRLNPKIKQDVKA